jgi:hypothetical protein
MPCHKNPPLLSKVPNQIKHMGNAELSGIVSKINYEATLKSSLVVPLLAG